MLEGKKDTRGLSRGMEKSLALYWFASKMSDPSCCLLTGVSRASGYSLSAHLVRRGGVKGGVWV